MKVKIATPEDIPDLLNISEEFVKEINLQYNKQKSEQTYLNYMYNQDTVVLLIKDKVSAGAALLGYEDEFYDDKLGVIMRFYIKPDFRKSGAGRVLANACTQWFDLMGCSESSATSGANISSQKNLFENLLSKFGYQRSGNIMTRKKP